MPVSFILIALILLFMLFYKKLPFLKTNKIIFGALMILLLIGFFVKPVYLFDKLNVNVIFAFCAIVLAFEFLVQIKTRHMAVVIAAAFAVSVVYYFLGTYSSDYLTIFNHLPVSLIIIATSALFIGSVPMALSYVFLSFTLVEFANFLIFSHAVGLLDLYSIHFLNHLIAVGLVVYLFSSAVAVAKANYKKKNKSAKKRVEHGK